MQDWELTKNDHYLEHTVRTGAANDAGSNGTPFAHVSAEIYKKAYKHNYANTGAGVEVKNS